MTMQLKLKCLCCDKHPLVMLLWYQQELAQTGGQQTAAVVTDRRQGHTPARRWCSSWLSSSLGYAGLRKELNIREPHNPTPHLLWLVSFCCCCCCSPAAPCHCSLACCSTTSICCCFCCLLACEPLWLGAPSRDLLQSDERAAAAAAGSRSTWLGTRLKLYT